MTAFARALRAAGSDPDAAPTGARPARFAPEMRALLASLRPLLDERRPAVLSVSACGPGEGASTVARELARAVAGDGRRTLLATPMPGAARSQTFGAHSSVVADLDLVDVAELHRAGADRRRVAAFAAWLADAKAGYGAVILDAPPILGQGGWEALHAQEDGALLVVEAERTRAAVLKASTEALAASGAHVLGIVFNRRRRRIPDLVYRWL